MQNRVAQEPNQAIVFFLSLIPKSKLTKTFFEQASSHLIRFSFLWSWEMSMSLRFRVIASLKMITPEIEKGGASARFSDLTMAASYRRFVGETRAFGASTKGMTPIGKTCTRCQWVDWSHDLAAAASIRSDIVLRAFDWGGNEHRINPSTNVRAPNQPAPPKELGRSFVPLGNSRLGRNAADGD